MKKSYCYGFTRNGRHKKKKCSVLSILILFYFIIRIKNMNSSRHNKKDKRSKKERKLSKLIKDNSDSEGEGSEHELSFYIKDRVRLMKEILKIIKPKKLKTMAPDCMKKMDLEEVNSLLLEELLGISSKRLRYIFEGKSLEEDSSSSDEDVKPEIDVISLDDISEDDFIIDLDSDKETSSKKQKRSSSSKTKDPSRKKLKKEKPDKEKSKEHKTKDKEKTGEENLMTVLELLELQARARAIRSQLVLESNRKAQEQAEKEKLAAQSAASKDNEDEEDAVIAVEAAGNIEIVITSESEEEGEVTHKTRTSAEPSTSNPLSSSTENIENISEKHMNENSSQEDCNVTEDSNFPRYSKQTVNLDTNKNNSETLNIISEKNNENNASAASHSENLTDIPLPKISLSKNNENIVDTAEITQRNSEQTDTVGNNSNEADSDNENLNVIRLRLIKKQEANEQVAQEKTKLEETVEKYTDANVSKDTATNLTQSAESEKSEASCVIEAEDTSQTSTASDTQSPNTEGTEAGASKLDICVKNVLEELKSTEPEKSPTPEVPDTDDGKQKSKERRILNLKNRLKSYKQELVGEPKIRIIDNVVVKSKSKPIEEERSSVEESEGIIINVDQDEFDCIICD